MIDEETYRRLGKEYARKIAEEMVSVQPMDEAAPALLQLMKNGKSREDLIEEGYKPVSKMGLMWIKPKDEE
jgi:hypothetical protein